MSTLKRDELSIIFQYLNGVDLHNASQVCSFWLEIAIEENNRRKPTWIMKKESGECLQEWKTIKTQFIDNCRTKPSLHFMYYICKSDKDHPKGCYCQYLPYNCCSITVEYYYALKVPRYEIQSTISNIFFPEIPNIKISTITLRYQPWTEGVYCEELKCLFDVYYNNADKLKTIFEPFTGNDIPMSSCVVFIYVCYNDILQNLVLRFKEWFPNKKMSIFSIETDNLSICNTNDNASECQEHADCIAILLNGTNMENWTHELKHNSFIEKEMTEFKKKVNLKKHSVCFMGTTKIDSQQFDCKHEKLFQTSFPNVPLFSMPCIGTIATNIIGDFYNSINRYNMDDYTGFLLLTYD